MEIEPIASDSLGTRSMATFIKTKDCKVLIDPGVALGPFRYGLEPHPREWRKLNTHWARIKKYANKADVLIVTHYHYDHHDPDEPKIYEGKILYTKHPEENINRSQKKRAAYFLNRVGNFAKKIEFSDGKLYKFGRTKIEFSEAVPHGTNTKLGYVTEVAIDDGKHRFLFTSDVEGPSLDEQTEFIFGKNADTIFCDGPMSYMLGYRYSKKSLEKSVENIIEIIEDTDVECFVLDHHLLRDLKWKSRIEKVYEAGEEQGTRILTFAEFLGKRIEILEARRKELYKHNQA